MTAIENMDNYPIDITELQKEGPDWSKLPSPAVERIYSFLNREDRISMSLVCRNWSEEYDSPSLWRNMTFSVPDYEHSTEISSDLIIVNFKGALFRRVKIRLVVDSRRRDVGNLFYEPDRVIKQLELLFETLACRSQLLSISLTEGVTPRLDNTEFETSYHRIILNFIKSQKKLQYFKIKSSHQRLIHEVLEALYLNNTKTLRYLYLRFEKELFRLPADITVDDNLNFLVFTNLEVLEMKFDKMFVKMMLSFYKYRSKVDLRERKGRLKEMRLRGYFDTKEEIHPHVWKYFREFFPDLRIHLHVTYYTPNILSSCMVAEMPLRTLKTLILDVTKTDESIASVFGHLISCGLDQYLEDLQIEWSEVGTVNFAEHLLSFTNVFSKLRTLGIEVLVHNTRTCEPHSLEQLEIVFNSWLENWPVSLHDVKIRIVLCRPIEEHEISYARLRDFYAPLLKQLKMGISALPDHIHNRSHSIT